MLITEFEEWMKEQSPLDHRERFGEFWDCAKFTGDVSAFEILEDLAWQVYNLQICVEGLIGDTQG